MKKAEVSKGTRLINAVVDLLVIYFLAIFLQIFLNGKIPANLILVLIYIIYYLTLEYCIGQTLGKLVTNSIVLDLKKNKPSFFRILLRTFLRFNPFDTISYLFGQEQGTHDILSRTRLYIKEK